MQKYFFEILFNERLNNLFLQSCKQVLGLELVQQSVDDARENAKINNVENCEFFVGKAEDILSSVCYKATTEDVIGIVDPPRAGLRKLSILE